MGVIKKRLVLLAMLLTLPFASGRKILLVPRRIFVLMRRRWSMFVEKP